MTPDEYLDSAMRSIGLAGSTFPLRCRERDHLDDAAEAIVRAKRSIIEDEDQ